jgi:hypothetical protein
MSITMMVGWVQYLHLSIMLACVLNDSETQAQSHS